MTLVTLELGPTWKMQLLCGVLEDRGVPAFVEDTNLKLIDPFITGALSLDARLKVPEEALVAAREALEEARRDGLDMDLSSEVEREFAAEHGAELGVEHEESPSVASRAGVELAELGRRLRWAALLFWLHPFVFLYGARYLRGLSRAKQVPVGNRNTLLALGVVSLLWVMLGGAVVRVLMGMGG